MTNIDVASEKLKCQAELNGLEEAQRQLQTQMVLTIQAINERRGILIYLESLPPDKPAAKAEE